MKLIGLMPCRNESWVIGLSLRAMLLWMDAVIVFDHASTDGTADIVHEVMGEVQAVRVVYTHEPSPTWAEMAHREWMLQAARKIGATHIAMVDADEVLTGNLLPNIRQTIEAIAPTGTVLQLPWLALPRTTERYLTSGVWSTGQQVSMAFPDHPDAHWALHGGRDFHHRNPMGIGRAFRAPLKPEQGGLLHLQFLSERRLRAKQCLYTMTEMIRWPAPCQLEGQHCATQAELAERLNWMYGRAVYESDPTKYASAPCPEEWWRPYAGLMKHLDIDAEPWQERECRRLIAEHGREKFQGLDFFGVV